MIGSWAIAGGYIAVVLFEAVSTPTTASYIFPGLEQIRLWSITGFDVHLTWALNGSIAALVIMWINIRGVKLAGLVQTWVVCFLILMAVLLLGGSAIGGDPANLQPHFTGGAVGFVDVLDAVPCLSPRRSRADAAPAARHPPGPGGRGGAQGGPAAPPRRLSPRPGPLRRVETTTDERTPPAMRLYLIRHGQTPSNVQRLLDTGEPGPGLTELGRQQAEALPEALAGAGIEALYASSLVRTQLTARPLADALGLEPAIRPGLREIGAGDLEMAGDDASVRTYLSTVFGWGQGRMHEAVPGSGEDGHDVLRRFDEVVQEVLDSGVQTAALFSHGAMIRAWSASRCRNLSPAFVAREGLGNTGAVVIEGDGSTWTALSWQDASLGPEVVDSGDDGPAAEPLDPSEIKG